MSRLQRPCLGVAGARCGALTRDSSGRCETCRRANDRRRGTTAERGYGADHGRLREQWAPRVATGTVHCHKPDCGQLIQPGEPWDLGHDEQRNYRGPEHRWCNRATRGPLRQPSEPYTAPPEPPPLPAMQFPNVVIRDVPPGGGGAGPPGSGDSVSPDAGDLSATCWGDEQPKSAGIMNGRTVFRQTVQIGEKFVFRTLQAGHKAGPRPRGNFSSQPSADTAASRNRRRRSVYSSAAASAKICAPPGSDDFSQVPPTTTHSDRSASRRSEILISACVSP